MSNIVSEVMRMARVRAKIYVNFPKLYDLMSFIDVEKNFDCPTLGVKPEHNGRFKLYWNPEFTSQFKDQDFLLGVWLHELLHIAFDHTTKRAPVDLKKYGPYDRMSKEDMRTMSMWNIACDMAINQFIRQYLDLGKPEFQGCFPEERNYPEWQSAETYFELLKKDWEKNKKDVEGLINKILDSHEGWGEPISDSSSSFSPLDYDMDDFSEETQKKIQEKIKEIKKTTGIDEVQKDQQVVSNKAGTSRETASSIKFKDTLIIVKIPEWMSKLTSSSIHGFNIRKESTRKRPNRRFGEYFPGQKKIQVGNKALILVDVSGSISQSHYYKFTGHINQLQKFANFDMGFFNTVFLDKQGQCVYDGQGIPDLSKTVRPFETGLDQAIGGGTSFELVVKFWNNVQRQYDVVFIFTDGEANYETRPIDSRNINWIVYTDNFERVKNNMRHGKVYPMSL